MQGTTAPKSRICVINIWSPDINTKKVNIRSCNGNFHKKKKSANGAKCSKSWVFLWILEREIKLTQLLVVFDSCVCITLYVSNLSGPKVIHVWFFRVTQPRLKATLDWRLENEHIYRITIGFKNENYNLFLIGNPLFTLGYYVQHCWWIRGFLQLDVKFSNNKKEN